MVRKSAAMTQIAMHDRNNINCSNGANFPMYAHTHHADSGQPASDPTSNTQAVIVRARRIR